MIRILVAAFLALITVPAVAQEQSAEQFLHAIYDQYKGTEGPPLDDAAMANYFTPDVYKLIKADSDAAAKKNEVPLLAGDPFIDAQDWKIDQLKIAVEEPKPGAATGIVTFQNFGELFEIKLDLLRTPKGWRIAEIYAPSGSLKELYKK
ncbi:hypothetical protein IZ6_20680 [Terrihabitans soli]|uniref:DUF3828 domain-containing protein n=1 Tax=Terrihabitans soli TaxID=708113 RepID=A0A6S6QJ91_9HYPH|nr:DUF3828 domain-containing protein [Terrihabitans soli]BCJ91333.1 hypothetical protein IZ6_20680 [Terrihabitans soli]